MQALGELSALKHESVERQRLHQQELEHQTGALKRQLADAREQHARASAEVEQLLASQEAMGMQYRAEARSIAERSEALVQELRAETERLTVRNAELSAQVRDQARPLGQPSASAPVSAALDPHGGTRRCTPFLPRNAAHHAPSLPRTSLFSLPPFPLHLPPRTSASHPAPPPTNTPPRQVAAAVAQGASLKASEREEASKVVRLQDELRQCQEGRTQIAAQLSQLRSKEASWEAEKKSLQRAGRAIAAAAAEDAARHSREGVRSAAAEAGSSSARRVARKRDPKAKAAESAAAEVEGALADARLQAGGPAQILQGRSKPPSRPSSSAASPAAPAAAAAPASKAAADVSPALTPALARKAPAALAPLGAPTASVGFLRSKLSPAGAAPPGAPSSGK
jgi:hypothetical protein